LLLHLHKNKSLHKFAGGFAKSDHPIYVQPIGTGMQCGNGNCIVADPAERQYAANKFYVIEDAARRQTRLRCVYCETDVDDEVAHNAVLGDMARKTFTPGLAGLLRAPPEKLKHLVIHRSPADAMAAGLQPREAGRKVHSG